jgi:CubicO group peptidase (beta-lactamase class C family)
MAGSGLSAGRLARVREIAARHVEGGSLPGLVTVVSRRGESHIEAVGAIGVGGDRPMQRDTIFRISSMTKPVTAAAALILVEECVLRLDDPIDRLIPELAGVRVLRRPDGEVGDTVPARRPISLRDLLTFRLGTGHSMAAGALPIDAAMQTLELGAGPPQPDVAPPPDEWLRRLGSVPLLYQPGEAWLYNTGSDVLGVLIARASGQPFETFLRERIFEPLGMVDTGFAVPADRLHRLPPQYFTDPHSGELDVFDESNGQWSRPPAFQSGAAGLVSTADDFLAFGQMLLGGGRLGTQRILSRVSVEAMTADQLTPQQRLAGAPYLGNRGWGFGVAVQTRRDGPSGVPGQFGWDGGLGTGWTSDPREDMVTILLTQTAWSSPSPPPVLLDFRTSAYQAIDD